MGGIAREQVEEGVVAQLPTGGVGRVVARIVDRGRLHGRDHGGKGFALGSLAQGGDVVWPEEEARVHGILRIVGHAHAVTRVALDRQPSLPGGQGCSRRCLADHERLRGRDGGKGEEPAEGGEPERTEDRLHKRGSGDWESEAYSSCIHKRRKVDRSGAEGTRAW